MAKKTTRITVKTERVWVISRRQPAASGWCPDCATEVTLVTAQAAAARAGLGLRALCRLVEEGRLHFTETADQSLWICLNSLDTLT